MNRPLTTTIGVLLLGTLGALPARAQEETAQEGPEAWTTPPAVQHELEGRGQCLMCHSGAMSNVPAVPDSHTDRTNDTCLWCHAPDAQVQTTTPATIPHELEGRHACLMCHRAGTMEKVPEVPTSHEGRTDEFCTLCHRNGGE